MQNIISNVNVECREQAGAQIEDPQQEVFNGQKVDVWPRVIWSPRWALTFADVCKKLSGSLHISQRSTLILDGAQILLEDVSLDGTLVLHAIPETEVRSISISVTWIILRFLRRLCFNRVWV